MNNLRTQHTEDMADTFFDYNYKSITMFYLKNGELFLRLDIEKIEKLKHKGNLTPQVLKPCMAWVKTEAAAFRFPTILAAETMAIILYPVYPEIERVPIPTANQDLNIEGKWNQLN